MAARDGVARFTARSDARTLEEAVRVIRRRRIIPDTGSQAAMIRALLTEASSIKRFLEDE